MNPATVPDCASGKVSSLREDTNRRVVSFCFFVSFPHNKTKWSYRMKEIQERTGDSREIADRPSCVL